MQLTEEALRNWIEALKKNPSTTVEAQPPSNALSQFTEPALWRLTMFATAYFYTPTPQDVSRLVTGVPDAFAKFDALTGKAMQFFYLPDSATIHDRSSKRWPDWKKLFEESRDDMVALHVMDTNIKEGSPAHSFDALCAFKPSSQPGGRLQSLSYLTVQFPLPLWQERRADIRQWWFDVLEMLKPEQAYMGIGFANPPQLERYPFIEPAEFALAKAFYGLDVDKPSFMCASPKAETKNYLEHGMRTSTFGVFVSPKYLSSVGGSDWLRGELSDEVGVSMEALAEGLWIQTGDDPQLLPVEAGIPRNISHVAKALEKARLDALWMLSYSPPTPRSDCFTYEASKRWLRRFDEDGDWPSAAARFWRDMTAPIQAPSSNQPASTPAGQPCPREGWWSSPAGGNSRRFFRMGEIMPDYGSKVWATIWQWDSLQ